MDASAARILAADDNELNRRILSKQLEKLGFAMDMVASGSEAVAAFHRGGYALVLMDVNMGEMDGYTAAWTIRRAEPAGARRVPIIATTASAGLREQQRCLDAGMDDLLSKPITLGALVMHLVRWGASRGSRPAEAAAPDSAKAAEAAEAAHLEAGAEAAHLAAGAVDHLRHLEQAAGQPGLADEVIDEFLEHVPARIRRIRKALERGRADKLEQERFALEMHSRGVGAPRLQQLAGELCRATPDQAGALIDAIEHEHAAVAAELGALR